MLSEGKNNYTDSSIIYITRNPSELFEAVRSFLGLMIQGLSSKSLLGYKIETRFMSPIEIEEIMKINKQTILKTPEDLPSPYDVPESLEPPKPKPRHLHIVPYSPETDNI